MAIPGMKSTADFRREERFGGSLAGATDPEAVPANALLSTLPGQQGQVLTSNLAGQQGQVLLSNLV